ncbi:MAG: hypothetical protein DDT26_00429 [Dehalococcoidia bacterium]|nr:hypothetical protein [Chloroflexota bacterium]
MYNPSTFTYGVELEYADVLVGQPLPDGCAWNDKDNTIVNSSGVANDPKGSLWKFGGEINTRPTSTVEEQVALVTQINDMLEPKPVINYRCNLHVHVRVPGLSDDLASCKKLLKYITEYSKSIFDVVEPYVPKPNPNDYTSKEAYDGAMKRYKRRFKSHQYVMPKSRVGEMMAASTVLEFYEAHAPLTEKGRMWYFSPRAAINLRQMWEETNTIEFRHFPGTTSIVEMESCIRWCRLFLDNVLNHDQPLTPRELQQAYGPFTFPEFADYNHELEKIYAITNHADNNRAVVAANIESLRASGVIS